MKKVLILTYYFPPANSVAGNRALSWAQNFYKYDLFPTVITRHWTGKEREWSDFINDNSNKVEYQNHETFDIYKYPSNKLSVFKFFKNNLLKISLFSKIIYFIYNYFGFLNPDTDAFTSFRKNLQLHLKDHHYDLILATSPPLNIIRLASEISNEFGIPYFVDFRDLWNNEYLRDDYKTKGFVKILENRKLFLISKWLKKANHCFAVSQPISDKLGMVYNGPRSIVYNGYDEAIFNNIVKNKRNYLCISFIGTYYFEQNLDILCDGLADFLKDKTPNQVRIQLVGVSSNRATFEFIKSKIPQVFIENVDRVSREAAAQLVVDSDILLHAGWSGFKGIFTTKVFDFLASGNNILLAPGDQDSLSGLIRETASGKIADNSLQVFNILSNWFDEWRLNGHITYEGNKKTTFYSRENQAEILVKDLFSTMGYSDKSEKQIISPIKALIVAYYFPPCNGAPAWRPYSWAKLFPSHNIQPTVITRHWKGNENVWEDFIEDNNTPNTYRKYEDYDVYFLPSRKSKVVKLFSTKYKIFYPFRKIVYFLLNSLGYPNTEVDAYLTFKDFLKQHLKINKYDVVIITYPPPNIAMLCKIVKQNSTAKLVLDFRDLWNNLQLENDYKPSFKQKYFDYCLNFYHKRWLKFPDLLTVVVDPFIDFIRKYTDKPIEVIYNGYENNIFVETKKNESTKFRFNVVGTIYPKQDCRILINGLKMFLKDKNPDDIIINFIGLNSIPEVSTMISHELPKEFLNITSRVSKELAVFYTKNAEILFYPGWKGVRGIVSTKAFDYIASGNIIILAPGDDDVLDELIISTNSGNVVNDEKEFEEILNKYYKHWQLQGQLNGKNNSTKVSEYSREYQAASFATHITNLVGK